MDKNSNILDLFADVYFAYEACSGFVWNDYELEGRAVEVFVEQAVDRLGESDG